MMILSFMAPVIQLLLLGYAATTDIKDIPMLVYDQDKSSVSRRFVDQFVNSRYFVIEKEASSLEEIDHHIEDGRVWMALVIPPNFGARMLAHRTVAVQILADGSDANSANISLGYASQIVAKYSRSIVAEVMERNPRVVQPAGLDPEVRVWYNPDLKKIGRASCRERVYVLV